MASDTQTTPYGALSASLNSNRLADLCLADGVQTGPFGSQLHQEDYVEDGTPIITVEHLGENRIVHQDLPRVSEEDKQRLAKYNLRTGDIVFSRVGSVDRRAIVREAENGWLFSGRCLRVRPNPEKLDPLWLSYFFGLSAFKQYIRGIAVGATMPSINTKILSDVPIYFPGLDQQRHAAKLLASLDDKIEINRRINQTLEAMAQAIFKSWFVDFDPVKAKIAAIEQGEDPLRAAMRAISGKTDAELDQMPREHYDQLATTAALFPDAMEESELGEIPKGWEISDFGSVSVCFDKNRIPLSKRQREDKKGNIPYYGATSVMDYVGEHIFDGVFLLLGEDGSVLREDGTPFVQYIWGKSWVNNHAHVLQGANGVSTEQLMLFISMQNISAYVTGAVQLKLNQKNMNSIPFVKATKDINAMFSRLIAPLYAKYRSMVEEIHSLTEYRDTLLPKLLSGEISVETLMNEVAQ